MNGIQIVFSVATGIGENEAASASDGVLPGSKPSLPAAATEPSEVTMTALLMDSVRARRSAVPEMEMRCATMGGAPESDGAITVPGDSKSKA